MSDDLIRHWTRRLGKPTAALDRIEAQAARIAELEAALRSIIEYCDEPYLHYTDMMSKARAALAGGKKDERRPTQPV